MAVQSYDRSLAEEFICTTPGDGMRVRSLKGDGLADAWMMEGMNRGQSLLERQRWGVEWWWRSGGGGVGRGSCPC